MGHTHQVCVIFVTYLSHLWSASTCDCYDNKYLTLVIWYYLEEYARTSFVSSINHASSRQLVLAPRNQDSGGRKIIMYLLYCHVFKPSYIWKTTYYSRFITFDFWILWVSKWLAVVWGYDLLQMWFLHGGMRFNANGRFIGILRWVLPSVWIGDVYLCYVLLALTNWALTDTFRGSQCILSHVFLTATSAVISVFTSSRKLILTLKYSLSN